MSKTKKILCILLSLLLTGSLVYAAAAAVQVDTSRPTAAHVAFNDEGKLKILQFADIQDDAVLAPIAQETLKSALDATKPDLILLTGDNIAGYSCGTKALARAAIRTYMNIFESYGIPVAMVYGNHDDDNTPLTKLEQIELYESYDCFIGCKGVVAEKTVGKNSTMNAATYNVPVYESKDSDKVIYNIWCIDSGNYNPDSAYGGYGYVLPEQIEWYKETSAALKEANGGVPVPSLAFQHIVPPQIKDALKEVPAGTPGAVGFAGSYYTLPDGTDPETNWMNEAPCPPNLDFAEGYAEVEAMLEMGDVRAVIFGHDHINAYTVNYNGIDLVSSPGFTYHSYNDAHRGVRTITIDKNDLDHYTTETLTATELLEGNAPRSAMLRLYNFFDNIVVRLKELWERLTAIFKK